MAGVDVGGGGAGARRNVAPEINMIPFVDLLFMMLAFLLVTAVWTTHSRMNANAQVPDNLDAPPTDEPIEKMLHVYVGADDFRLVWKQGETIVSETKVEKDVAEGDRLRYAALSKRVQTEWASHGSHKAAHDAKLDNVVLHASNEVPYKELAAVMDAVYATKRELAVGQKTMLVPALNLTFSVR